jgi:hypothetical protein
VAKCCFGYFRWIEGIPAARADRRSQSLCDLKKVIVIGVQE